jgi:hypothetical protein
MDINQIVGLIKPDLFIIVALCYVFGLFLKNLPKVKDWTIPFILLLFSIVMTVMYIAVVLGEGFTAKVIVLGIIQGFLCAAVAVYGNEALKQLVVKRPKDTK